MKNKEKFKKFSISKKEQKNILGSGFYLIDQIEFCQSGVSREEECARYRLAYDSNECQILCHGESGGGLYLD